MQTVVLFTILLFICKAQTDRDTVIEEENTLIETTKTKIAFGSCYFPGKDTRIFDVIAKRNADLFIWTGDATYLDYKQYDPESDWHNLRAQFFGIDSAPPSEWKHTWDITKSDKNYQKLLETGINIIGTWDDHDFGLNNGNGVNNKHKDYAQELFLDFLDIPLNSPKREQAGVYEYYEMVVNISNPINNTITRKVIDIILLDIRYFAKVDGNENMLGDEQWEWLEDIFDNKLHGELTIIVSSLQTIPISRDWECWHKFGESRNKFYDMIIRKNTNKRLVILSGDLHFAELLQMQCIDYNTNHKQNIYEVTSSGLTHGAGDIESFLIRTYDHLVNYLAYDGIWKCRYNGRNFGELDIIWQWNDNINDLQIVNVTAFILDIEGNEECKLDLPLWNENDNINIQYDTNGVSLWNYNNYTCYGGVKQHDMIEINDYSFKKSFYDVYYIGVVAVFIIYVIIMCCLVIFKKMNWCEKCTKWIDKSKTD